MVFFKKNRFILILLLIVFVLRLPSLFEPYWYGDEGIYLTIGQAVRHGLVLYRDIFDNKPPLIYIITALANGVQFWFRFYLLISVLSSIFLFFKLSEKITNNQNYISKMAAIIFAILTTIPLLEGNIANAEIFILFPVLLGFVLIFSLLGKKDGEIKNIFLVGVILGTSFLLKATAVFDFAALLFFLIFFQTKTKFFNFGKREIILIIGYFLPFVLTVIYFLSQGALRDYIGACFLKTVGYLKSWETGTQANPLLSLLSGKMIIKIFLVLSLSIFLWWKKKRLDSPIIFTLIWFAFSLFSATLSGRPYPHYLIQTIPPLSLIISLIFSKNYRKFIYIFIVPILLFVLAVAYYRFWFYRTIAYYQNFLEFSVGLKSKNEYFSYFGTKTPIIYSLANFITLNSRPEDKIFIWADEPCLYSLSRRLPASSFTVAYHIIEQNAYQAVAEQISKEEPPLIIVDQKGRPFLGLEEILIKNYSQVLAVDNFLVFQRRKI